jgi:hypothetical protein
VNDTAEKAGMSTMSNLLAYITIHWQVSTAVSSPACLQIMYQEIV